jgi:hypothetical protein
MTRLFTLTFPFEQKMYDAEVTVNDAAAPHIISVYVSDKSLHPILPGGKVVLTLQEELPGVSKKAPAIEQLKHNILQAFKAHERKTPPVSTW